MKQFDDFEFPVEVQEVGNEERLIKKIESFKERINFILKELPTMDLDGSKKTLDVMNKEVEMIIKENKTLKWQWQVLSNIKLTLEKKLQIEKRAEEIRANQKKEMEMNSKEIIDQISKVGGKK